jgi:hypothetical protein
MPGCIQHQPLPSGSRQLQHQAAILQLQHQRDLNSPAVRRVDEHMQRRHRGSNSGARCWCARHRSSSLRLLLLCLLLLCLRLLCLRLLCLRLLCLLLLLLPLLLLLVSMPAPCWLLGDIQTASGQTWAAAGCAVACGSIARAQRHKNGWLTAGCAYSCKRHSHSVMSHRLLLVHHGQ